MYADGLVLWKKLEEDGTNATDMQSTLIKLEK